MKKDLIIYVFPTLMRAGWYFEDVILRNNPNIKKVSLNHYENDGYVFKLFSADYKVSMRGLRPEHIFLSEECNIDDYNFVIELVNDHDKITVI